MVQYTQYGLNHIDTLSNSSMATNVYSIAVNDTSENYKYVIVTGSIQYSLDATGIPRWGLIVGSDRQACRYRLMNSGITGTLSASSSGVDVLPLAYYNTGNDNYTTLTGQMTHFIIELDYTKSGGNTASAPYKRKSARWQTFYYSGSNPHTTYGTASFTETNEPVDELFFTHSGGGTNISVNATSYGIGSITST